MVDWLESTSGTLVEWLVVNVDWIFSGAGWPIALIVCGVFWNVIRLAATKVGSSIAWIYSKLVRRAPKHDVFNKSEFRGDQEGASNQATPDTSTGSFKLVEPSLEERQSVVRSREELDWEKAFRNRLNTDGLFETENLNLGKNLPVGLVLTILGIAGLFWQAIINLTA